ncbi:MAG: hypothetical protein HDS03_08015 [Bacteroides sp.]|nr:hypothetical protein [Bacteroides sp.]
MNRFIYLLFSCSLLLLSLSGCEDYMDVAHSQEKSAATLYSIDNVISRANYFYSVIFENTRAHTPKINSIIPISTTRSCEEGMPVYYIVNYNNNAGFVVVGANEISKPILAISDESTLSLDDINEIEPLKTYMDIATTQSVGIDTLTQEPTTPLNISITPKLHPNVRKWGQASPFNSYTPLVNGQHTLVGCIPLATAMMMSYYEWPIEHKGRTLNWKSYKSNYSNDLFLLLAELGEPENLNVNYGLEGSSTIYSYIHRTMKNYDYLSKYSYVDLVDINLNPTEECKSEIESILPLLMSGWGYNRTTNEGGFGHAWVIDGLLHIPYDPNNKLNPNNSPDKYFFHCVWGWAGRANGYYLFDGFESIGGNRHSKDGGDKTYPGYEDTESPYVFNNWVWGYYGFKKKPIISGGVEHPVTPIFP